MTAPGSEPDRTASGFSPTPGTVFVPGEYVESAVPSQPPADAHPPLAAYGQPPLGWTPHPRPEPPPPARTWRTPAAILFIGVCLVATVYIFSAQQFGVDRYEGAPLIEFQSGAPTEHMQGASLDDTEKLAAALPIRRDGDDSFVSAGQSLVSLFGMELVWEADAPPTRCIAPVGEKNVHVASFCELEPYTVRVNGNHLAMPEFLYHEVFTDTVKHEISHHIIYLRCGTSVPAAAGARYEGVTNSYAVLYLGADRDRITPLNPDGSDYSMSKETDAAARRIHAGDCG